MTLRFDVFNILVVLLTVLLFSLLAGCLWFFSYLFALTNLPVVKLPCKTALFAKNSLLVSDLSSVGVYVIIRILDSVGTFIVSEVS